MRKKQQPNERIIKTVSFILLGTTVPNVFGLISNSLYSITELAFSYSYFIFIILLVWNGNTFIMRYLPKKMPWHRTLQNNIAVILFFSNIIFSGLISAALFLLWQHFSREPASGNQKIISTSMLIIIISSFITNIYEIIYLNNERRSTLSKVEQLNIAKIQAELEVLKNQTDPHFIFNSLNTLSFLISTDAESAKHFTNTLAGVYRYIVLNKEKDFVMLKEEIEFISNYFYLLKIRFGDAINMVIEINDVLAEDFLIPPISLQILVENAVKHNEFSEKFPMEINVSIMPNYVQIKNAIRKKQILPNSAKSGLKNLNNRYQFLTRRNIIIQTVNNLFIAKLPILKF